MSKRIHIGAGKADEQGIRYSQSHSTTSLVDLGGQPLVYRNDTTMFLKGKELFSSIVVGAVVAGTARYHSRSK